MSVNQQKSKLTRLCFLQKNVSMQKLMKVYIFEHIKGHDVKN